MGCREVLPKGIARNTFCLICMCVCGLEGGWMDVCACVSEKVYRPSETNRMCIHVRLYNNIRCGETANFFYLRILPCVIPTSNYCEYILFYSGVFVRSYFTIKPLQYIMYTHIIVCALVAVFTYAISFYTIVGPLDYNFPAEFNKTNIFNNSYNLVKNSKVCSARYCIDARPFLCQIFTIL